MESGTLMSRPSWTSSCPSRSSARPRGAATTCRLPCSVLCGLVGREAIGADRPAHGVATTQPSTIRQIRLHSLLKFRPERSSASYMRRKASISRRNSASSRLRRMQSSWIRWRCRGRRRETKSKGRTRGLWRICWTCSTHELVGKLGLQCCAEHGDSEPVG